MTSLHLPPAILGYVLVHRPVLQTSPEEFDPLVFHVDPDVFRDKRIA